MLFCDVILQREGSPTQEEINKLLKGASGSHDNPEDDDIVVAEYHSDDEAEKEGYMHL